MEGKLRERDELIQKLQKSIQTGENLSDEVTRLLDKVNSISLKNLIQRSAEALARGKVTFTVKDFYQFWTDLYIENDVIFFRCTSRHNPELWMNPDMQLYERRQIANAISYRQKSPKEKEKLVKIIKKKLKSIRYDCDNNFERIFIIDEVQRGKDSLLDALTTVISRQVRKGIRIKAICIKSNERPTFGRPQDFGILLTGKGDRLLMYSDVGVQEEQQGGQVIFNDIDIEEFEKHYQRIEEKSHQINTDRPRNIRKTITQLPSIDISDIFGNRCFHCLLDADKKAESGEWEYDKTPKKTWYEIVKDENDFVRNLLLEKKPRSVLEIGYHGSGRVIRQALQLKDEIGISLIEGYEQNPNISMDVEDLRGVRISPVLVGEDQKGKWHTIREKDIKRFDIVFMISNLVGWQRDEKRYVAEVLRAGKSFFFTVYKKGFELERARMYEASGDIIKFSNKEHTQIELVVDAFQGEKHVSKAYEKEQIKAIMESIAREIPVKYRVLEVGKYMWGCLIEKQD